MDEAEFDRLFREALAAERRSPGEAAALLAQLDEGPLTDDQLQALLMRRARVVAEAGRANEAHAILLRAQRLWPGTAWPYLHEGEVLLRNGDAAAANAALERAVAMASTAGERHVVRQLLGEACLAKGDAVGALRALDESAVIEGLLASQQRPRRQLLRALLRVPGAQKQCLSYIAFLERWQANHGRPLNDEIELYRSMLSGSTKQGDSE